jgi:hypothetical protein
MPFITQGKTNIKYILIVVILAAIAGGGILAYQYWWVPKHETQKPVACTLEAKVCPDGSAVGRTGPDCEFAPCPTVKPDETANWKTYINSQYGFELKYPPTGTMKEGIGYAGTTPTSFTLSFSNPADSQRFELQIMYKDTDNHLEDFACSSGTEEKTCFTEYRIINGVRIVVTTFVRDEGEGAGTKEKSAIAINGGKLLEFYTGFDPLLQKYTLVDLSKDKFLFDQILSTFKFIK